MGFGNKYSKNEKHVVSIGGGLSSTVELPLEVIRRYGADNVDFFICALAGESPDLWRLVDWLERETGKRVIRVAWTPYKVQNHYGMEANYWIDAPEWAWSDIWGAFFHAGMMGNSRVDPCSRLLKRETAMSFLKDYYDFERTTLHVGIQIDEIDRMLAIRKRYNAFGFRVEAPLADDEYINSKSLEWYAMDNAQRCLQVVGFVPFVYAWGAAHNNCGGFCVKAGKAHMRRFLLNDRETFLYHEEQERRFQALHGGNYTIMTYSTSINGKSVKHPLSLREFRTRIERQVPMFELDETPGCSFCESA